jgi:hypothetical protein
MEKDSAQLSQADNQKAIRDLMEDLNLFGCSSGDENDAANESIDLMVDQAIHGVDIRNRFPTFYKKLLQNKQLRQQFIDAITTLVPSSTQFIDPYKGSTQFNFSFLKSNLNKITDWPVFITQSCGQLMKIFFAVEPEFRSAADPGAEPSYTLLRKDFILSGITYTVIIDSILAEEEADTLNASLSLTAENTEQESIFPVQVSLRWGEYSTELSIDQEGKHPLPAIPLALVLNDDLSKVKSDLFLTLNSATY